jgi:hypothetical protein
MVCHGTSEHAAIIRMIKDIIMREIFCVYYLRRLSECV